MKSDTELLDFLQHLTDQTDFKVKCRWSSTGRGWRLHETTQLNGFDSIREAIDFFLENEIAEEAKVLDG